MKSRLLSRLLSFLEQNEENCSDFLQPVVIGDESAPMFFRMCCKETLKEANIRCRVLGLTQPSVRDLKPLGLDLKD